MILGSLREPIVQAPMAGGPSTPALAAAVGDAGGFGFLAAGYKTVEGVEEDIADLRRRTRRPFGVNLFVPGDDRADAEDLRPFVARLAAEAERYGAPLGEPRRDDDHWREKLALLELERVAVASFVFGCPPSEVLGRLGQAGIETWVTVTGVAEAAQAVEAGADALVVQGHEAGGHRGSFRDVPEADAIGLLALLALVRAAVDVPIVGAGGISNGAGVAAVLCAGASAAQLGTALMRTPEAATSPAHREALGGTGRTGLTRAFTGRLGRGIVNRFQEEHTASAPLAYPEIHHVTAPVRAAARRRQDPDGFNLWAGQGFPLSRGAGAGEIVREFGAEMRETLARLSAAHPPAPDRR